jgi:hypothetical protein
VLDSAVKAVYPLDIEVSDPGVGTDTAVVTIEILADTDVVYVDPQNSADPNRDGSWAHPFASFADFSFTAGKAYLFRRETTLTHDDGVALLENDMLLGAYGSGARPVYHCTANDDNGNKHAFVNWNGQQNLTIRDLEIYAPQATSCVRLMGESGAAATIDNCVIHGSGWGIRAFSVTGLRIIYTNIYDIADDGMYIQDCTQVEAGANDIHDVNTNAGPDIGAFEHQPGGV